MTTTGISFQTTNGTNVLTFDTTGDIGILTGNPLGTFDISSPYFVIVPKGTTGQRPGNYTGCIRFNSTLGILEGYRGGSSSGWWPLYNQGSDDMKSRISFDDGLDANYNIHFYTNNTKRMTLTEGGNLCIGSTSGSKKINVSGAINSDNLYYNGTLFKTIPDYIYQNLTFNDTYGSRNSGYYDTHSIDVSQNLDVSGTPTINTKLYVYNYYNQPYSTKIRGDFETSRLELTDMQYNNALNIGASTGNLPYSRNGDVRVNTSSKHFQVYYNNNWRTSKSLQRPFMAFESNGTASIPSTNALNVLQRVNLNGGKFITNDSTTFNCLGTSRTTSRFIINKPGLYLLTIGVYFSNSNHKFRYILFKSNGNNTAVTSPDFYSPGTRDYLFNDTGLDTGPLWSNVDSNQESQVNGANYYHQVQDFGELRLGDGLNEKTIPFILESGKSITMFAAYQSSFQKLTMKFLRLGPLESVIGGTTTTTKGITSTLLFSDLVRFTGGINSSTNFDNTYNEANFQSNNNTSNVTYGSKNAYTQHYGVRIDHPNGSNNYYGGWWSDANHTYRSVRIGANSTLTTNIDWLGIDNADDGDPAVEFCFVGGGGGGGGHFSWHSWTNTGAGQGGGGGGGTMVTRKLNMNTGTHTLQIGAGGSGGSGTFGGNGHPNDGGTGNRGSSGGLTYIQSGNGNLTGPNGGNPTTANAWTDTPYRTSNRWGAGGGGGGGGGNTAPYQGGNQRGGDGTYGGGGGGGGYKNFDYGGAGNGSGHGGRSAMNFGGGWNSGRWGGGGGGGKGNVSTNGFNYGDGNDNRTTIPDGWNDTFHAGRKVLYGGAGGGGAGGRWDSTGWLTHGSFYYIYNSIRNINDPALVNRNDWLSQSNFLQDTAKIFAGTEAEFVQNGYHRYGGGGGRGENYFNAGNAWDNPGYFVNAGVIRGEGGANLFGGGGGGAGRRHAYGGRARTWGGRGGSGCIIIRFRFPRDPEINWSQNGASI